MQKTARAGLVQWRRRRVSQTTWSRFGHVAQGLAVPAMEEILRLVHLVLSARLGPVKQDFLVNQ